MQRVDVSKLLDNLGSADHIPASIGDFIADDGFLHCGKCGKRKEFQLPMNGKMVPVMCDCIRAEQAAEEEARRQSEMRAKVDRMKAYSVIDSKFYDCTFDRFEVRNAEDQKLLRRLKAYTERFADMFKAGKGLLLYGPPGTGKSFAAYCIANALMAQGVPVLVSSIIRLTTKSAFDEDRADTIQAIREAGLLVLDDFGAERDSGFMSEQIFDIIDTRINAKKPMIVTSNISDYKQENDIRRARVYDRLSDACIPLRIDGESRRRQKARAETQEYIELLDKGAMP